jgi:hypothetical protein
VASVSFENGRFMLGNCSAMNAPILFSTEASSTSPRSRRSAHARRQRAASRRGGAASIGGGIRACERRPSGVGPSIGVAKHVIPILDPFLFAPFPPRLSSDADCDLLVGGPPEQVSFCGVQQSSSRKLRRLNSSAISPAAPALPAPPASAPPASAPKCSSERAPTAVHGTIARARARPAAGTSRCSRGSVPPVAARASESIPVAAAPRVRRRRVHEARRSPGGCRLAPTPAPRRTAAKRHRNRQPGTPCCHPL